jgi:PKD repeat protein
LGGAATISSLLASNRDNTSTCVQEPYANANGENYGVFIEDLINNSHADLNGYGPVDSSTSPINLENDTVAPFTTPVISDLYELRPNGTTDPHTGLTSGAGYNVGYFQFNVNGTMTFTRASAVSVPSAGAITSTVTNGFSPLTVVFTNSATGNITNWVWNFGNGTVITNTTGGNVTNTYAISGNYSVSLTVYGPGGTNSVTDANYIVASPTPKFGGLTLANGKLVLNGTNLPVGIQYRILNATNVSTPLANWKSVLTNFFLSNGSFSYTNSLTNTAGFFRLVSP